MPCRLLFCTYTASLHDSALLPEYLRAVYALHCHQRQIHLNCILLIPAFLTQYSPSPEKHPAVCPPGNSSPYRQPSADTLSLHCRCSYTSGLLLWVHGQENHNVLFPSFPESEKDSSVQDLSPAAHIFHIFQCSFFPMSVSLQSWYVPFLLISSYTHPLFDFAIR